MATPIRIISVEIGENPPVRLDKALALFAPVDALLSRSRLVKLVEEGAVSLDGTVITVLKTKSAEGQVYEVAVPEAADLDTVAEDIPLVVIYEDESLIVVDKPAGMVVHPAPGSPSGTLVNALLHHCADSLSGIGGSKRPGIVHRIDKETSGLLVVAKSDKAHQGLAKQFEKHTVERRYQALVYGVPDAGDPRLTGMPGVAFEGSNILRINANLARHRTDRQRQAVTKHGGRHATTRARVLDTFGTPPTLSLLECWLETGRTHQIRVHMAHVGHSLIGDPTYGGKRKLGKAVLNDAAKAAVSAFPRQALHAATLGFIHPVSGEKMEFEAALPQDFTNLIDIISTK